MSAVNIRFQAKHDIYEKVDLVLRHGTCEIVREECCRGRPGVEEHLVSLSMTPKACGELRLALDVVCCVTKPDTMKTGTNEGMEILPAYFETHTAAMSIVVDDKRSNTYSPTINIAKIEQSQTSSGASDPQGGTINVTVESPKFQPEDDSARYKMSTCYLPLRTELCMSPARLTLKCDNEVLQLVSDGQVTFGRSRDNTIPTRVFGADGRIDDSLNYRIVNGEKAFFISRHHFTIEHSGADCIVCDVKIGTACGVKTRVDSFPLPQCGYVRLVPERVTILDVGCNGPALKMHVTFHRDEWGRAAGFMLDRLDGARQRVCAVWRDMPLEGGASISWNGSLWRLSADKVSQHSLVVGTTVSIGGRSFDVQPFHQTHLD